jgi:hypothetical protein
VGKKASSSIQGRPEILWGDDGTKILLGVKIAGGGEGKIFELAADLSVVPS